MGIRQQCESMSQRLPQLEGAIHGVNVVNDPSRIIWLTWSGEYRVSVIAELDSICSTPALTSEIRDRELFDASISLEDYLTNKDVEDASTQPQA